MLPFSRGGSAFLCLLVASKLAAAFLSTNSRQSASFLTKSHHASNKIEFQVRAQANVAAIIYDDFDSFVGERDELDANPHVDAWRVELNTRTNRQKFTEYYAAKKARLRESTRWRRLSGGDGQGDSFGSVQPTKTGDSIPAKFD